MKVKVNEATGVVLDWMVGEVLRTTGVDWTAHAGRKYSADWSQGGPIIEREKIDVDCWLDGDYWQATSDTYDAFGPTPLIAAMRCYVASKLGEEVEVPDDVL